MIRDQKWYLRRRQAKLIHDTELGWRRVSHLKIHKITSMGFQQFPLIFKLVSKFLRWKINFQVYLQRTRKRRTQKLQCRCWKEPSLDYRCRVEFPSVGQQMAATSSHLCSLRPDQRDPFLLLYISNSKNKASTFKKTSRWVSRHMHAPLERKTNI